MPWNKNHEIQKFLNYTIFTGQLLLKATLVTWSDLLLFVWVVLYCDIYGTHGWNVHVHELSKVFLILIYTKQSKCDTGKGTEKAIALRSGTLPVRVVFKSYAYRRNPNHNVRMSKEVCTKFK